MTGFRSGFRGEMRGIFKRPDARAREDIGRLCALMVTALSLGFLLFGAVWAFVKFVVR